ncbi:MAG: FMN-binding protein [Acidobacteria bacterium]|nr:FMN-binding protein [Acidobacteriota bacterium]
MLEQHGHLLEVARPHRSCLKDLHEERALNVARLFQRLACFLDVPVEVISRDEALAAVFPGAVVVAERVFLTAQQMAEIAEIAGVEIESGLVARYVATRNDTVMGRAYVDTHVVRTKRESLLISLEADGSVRRIDVTAFLEPPDYLAPERWLRQYTRRQLDDDLALQRAIRPIAGATLTANATNAAVRRVLAIDQILEQVTR